jgi:hypothetical protein
MRVKSEDILKPGAVLRTEKIDFNDPEIKAMLKAHKKACQKLNHRWTQEDYDNLRKVITI